MRKKKEFRNKNPFVYRYNKLREHCDVGYLTPKILENIFIESEGFCFYCGKEISIDQFEIDHAIPVCKGGTNDRENLRICCISCNRRKGKLTDSEYFMKIHGTPF